MGYVFPMVIWPEFRVAKYKDDDKRKTPHFMMLTTGFETKKFSDNSFATIVKIDNKEPNTQSISVSWQGWLDYSVIIFKFPDFGFKG